MSLIAITKENFRELAEGPKPLLIDFWAPWCGPCRMIAPILEQIAAEREDVLVAKLNVDEEMELAAEFGVVSIPTLVLLREGHFAGQLIGYQTKEKILQLLDA